MGKMYTRPIRSCIALALVAALPACSIRPLPETAPTNFPRASTYDIVHRVRCEAKEALDKLLHGRRREHVTQIINATSIGYDFEFTMTEVDDADGGILAFGNKTTKKNSVRGGSLAATGSATRSRQNVRSFRIVEDLADVARADCSPLAVKANLAYPISGRLRVDDVVRTYVRLEMISNLEPPDDDDHDLDVVEDAGSKDKPRSGVFSEHLEFRTIVSVGVNPTVQLSPVSRGLSLTEAGVELSSSRRDKHSLIVAFAQDPNFKDPKVKRAWVERVRALQNRDVPGARTAASVAQAVADKHNRLVLELSRLRNLRNDEQEGAKFLGRQLLRFLRPPDESESENQP